jgi:hypothetical protein
VCEENFEKKCQITFRQEASKETVRKCYKPQKKECNGQGPEECRVVYESSCTTRSARIRIHSSTTENGKKCREKLGIGNTKK